jgi:lipopolysaccharide/colanic/teichoic acid biosynthesis glycosyltransferase
VRERRERRPAAPHLLNQDVFKALLLRECRRADRCDTSFMLLVFAIDDEHSQPGLRQVVEALASVKRRMDVIGWFEQGRAVGLLLPDINSPDADTRRALESRLRDELARRLTADALSRVRISAHFHQPGAALGEHADGSDLMPAARAQGRRRILLLKRALDLVLGTMLLVLMAPLLAAIAILVKLTSRGPVLFKQERVGEHAKPFRMLKFRSMKTGADHAIHRTYVTSFIQGSAQSQSGEPGVFKIVRDPRVTPIGRILRKTSLDELPQLINVVRGEMSLVGPRPPLPYEVEQYKTWHRRRVFDAKPGVTGLWQVTGRSRTTFDEMVRLDLRYARTRSVWTDLKILLATPRAVVSGRGAC